jgi:hypothetical protein
MKTILGALLAAIVLLLYLYAVYRAVRLARQPAGGIFSDGLAAIMQGGGGMTSAVVVALLGLTKAGQLTWATPLVEHGGRHPLDLHAILTGAYALAWFAAGLTALVVGWILYPRKVDALTAAGQAWFGVALVAGYSFFALPPPGH